MKVTLFALIMFLSSCVSTPFTNVEVETETGEAKKEGFRYGKYCGAGHPYYKTSKPQSPDRIRDLKNDWPPDDDIDLMCYAHDMCYEQVGKHNQICDEAMSNTARVLAKSFKRETGCENLSKLIAGGLGSKFWGKEKGKVSSSLIAIGNLVWRLPINAAIYGANYNKFKKYGFPEVSGTCNKGGAQNLHPNFYIGNFRAQYRNAARAYSFSTFGLATPTSYDIDLIFPGKWEPTPELILEIQTKLNRLGYDAGSANGKFGAKTSAAILEYQNSKYNSHDKKYFSDGKPSYMLLNSIRMVYKVKSIFLSLPIQK